MLTTLKEEWKGLPLHFNFLRENVSLSKYLREKEDIDYKCTHSAFINLPNDADVHIGILKRAEVLS